MNSSIQKRFTAISFILSIIVTFSACGPWESVTINAPVEIVWGYVSDSAKASEWSVYERVIKSIPNEYRQIHIFNIHNFKEELYNQAEYRVHQYYKRLGAEKTQMTFAADLIKPTDIFNLLKFSRQIGEINRIFRLNLENIKEGAEALYQKRNYERIHSYEVLPRWE